MAKKLHYFNLNALGEPIRYILHYSGEKFEDVRHEIKTWPVKEVKDSLPYGQFPLYEENGKKLHQSIAIARYLAVKAHLLPSDPWEQAVLDAVVLTIYDFYTKVAEYARESDVKKKEALKKVILSETLDFFLSRFEKDLKENHGHFGKKLSWADFIFVGIIEAINLFLGVNVEANYPVVSGLIAEITSLPGIKEYIAKRKPYAF